MLTDPKKAYLNTRATSSVHNASPHKLILLLLEACQENLAIAKGAIGRKDVKLKAESIKKAREIVVRLQSILDFEKGGSVAQRLDDLYNFCTNRLALANAANDTECVDQVYKVIAEIKAGWIEIGEEITDVR